MGDFFYFVEFVACTIIKKKRKENSIRNWRRKQSQTDVPIDIQPQ